MVESKINITSRIDHAKLQSGAKLAPFGWGGGGERVHCPAVM